VGNSQVKALEPARLVSYKSQEVVIEANPSAPALLMLNDTAYPGWQVEVDGKPSMILTADYYFRGVFLEAGRHRVRFVYQPRAFETGLLISAAALALFVVSGYLLYQRNRLPANFD
jgi:uncharacterized membrane protein YfhO